MNQQENILPRFIKKAIIPQKYLASQLIQQKQTINLIDIYTEAQSNTRELLVNGELAPILIIFQYDQSPYPGELPTDDKQIQSLIEMIQKSTKFYIHYLIQDEVSKQFVRIPNFGRFLDSNVTIESEIQQNDIWFQYDDKSNTLVFCKLFPIIIDAIYLNKTIEMKITIEYHNQDICQWIHKDNEFHKGILRNNLIFQSPQIYSYELSEQIIAINPLIFNFDQNEDLTENNETIQFKICCNKQLTQIFGPNQVEIHNIECVLPKSTLQWFDDQNKPIRLAPQGILQNIQLQRTYTEQFPIKMVCNEVKEGFYDFKINWQAILQNENEYNSQSPNLPEKNGVHKLIISTPILVRWKFIDENYFFNNIYRVNWQLKPAQEIGAKVTEVARYKQEGSEYLALKLQISNYSGNQMNLIMNLSPEIYGQRFKQQNHDYLQVLAVCLTTSKKLEQLQGYSDTQTLIRLRLLNKGIMHIKDIDFYDVTKQKNIKASLNFLYSFEQ